jgi:hypothetical protein
MRAYHLTSRRLIRIKDLPSLWPRNFFILAHLEPQAKLESSRQDSVVTLKGRRLRKSFLRVLSTLTLFSTRTILTINRCLPVLTKQQEQDKLLTKVGTERSGQACLHSLKLIRKSRNKSQQQVLHNRIKTSFSIFPSLMANS